MITSVLPNGSSRALAAIRPYLGHNMALLWLSPIWHTGSNQRHHGRRSTAGLFASRAGIKRAKLPVLQLHIILRQAVHLPRLEAATIPMHLSVAQRDQTQRQIVAGEPFRVCAEDNDWGGPITAC
jgi:hypothetical protein